jgi:hypothetical protein
MIREKKGGGVIDKLFTGEWKYHQASKSYDFRKL